MKWTDEDLYKKYNITEEEIVIFAFEKIDKIDQKALSSKNYQSVHTFLKKLISKKGLKYIYSL